MLTKDNFIQYAIKSYDNPQCKTLEEFEEDVKKISLVKKVLNSDRYDAEYVRMTLNTIVYVYNVFETEPCTNMLFFKVRKEHWSRLKTYLVFLNHMPEEIPELDIVNSNIDIDLNIATELRLI